MKKYMFIVLAMLVASCEKPVLDEDIVPLKEANVILHMVLRDFVLVMTHTENTLIFEVTQKSRKSQK